jgi:hypothetical protein
MGRITYSLTNQQFNQSTFFIILFNLENHGSCLPQAGYSFRKESTGFTKAVFIICNPIVIAARISNTIIPVM